MKKRKKLPKRLKKQWLKALRSGEYKQGQGALCAKAKDGEEKYCCLGVLYDSTQDDWYGFIGSNWCAKNRMGYYSHVTFGDGIMDEDDVTKLMNMNDSGKSFKKIADWIEKNL